MMPQKEDILTNRKCPICKETFEIGYSCKCLKEIGRKKQELPSEAIKRVGDEAELEWLKTYGNNHYEVTVSSFKKLSAQVQYIQKFLDEIYNYINKTNGKN